MDKLSQVNKQSCVTYLVNNDFQLLCSVVLHLVVVLSSVESMASL